jgi:ubiquinone/menaquinone biosynthesis C-methylase UbiE
VTTNGAARLDAEIQDYYNRTSEESRLATGAFRLEELRTRELIVRHVPPPPAMVIDVGGAGGAYAFWFARQGYSVRLIDAVPRLVEVARARNETEEFRLTSCEVGDARSLQVGDESADVVLLLGPLYHLIEAAGRHQALIEALRILRPGGTLIAAGISRWASVLDGLSREMLAGTFAGIVQKDLAEGIHRNTTDRLEFFTTAYFHLPDELRDEAESAGFEIEALYGVEGPGWMFPDFDARWNDERRRAMMVEAARALESEPAMIGCSAHLIVVGRKPEW